MHLGEIPFLNRIFHWHDILDYENIFHHASVYVADVVTMLAFLFVFFNRKYYTNKAKFMVILLLFTSASYETIPLWISDMLYDFCFIIGSIFIILSKNCRRI